MEVKLITKEQFAQKGYGLTGSLDGTFADAQDYLGWVLNSVGTKSENGKLFEKSIEVFRDRFNMPYFTTKYLKGLITDEIKNKSTKVGQILKLAGYGHIPTKRYFHGMRSVEKVTNNLIYKYNDGKFEPTNRLETKSRLARCFIGETLNKIVPKQEIDKWNDIANNLSFCLYFGIIQGLNPIKEEPKEEVKIEDTNFITLECQGCKGNIKIPFFPDMDNNIEQQKIWNTIYEPLIKDIQEGIAFCKDCQKDSGRWFNAKVKEFLLEVLGTYPENEGISFKASDFCLEYRKDKKEIEPMTVRAELNELLSDFKLDENLKVFTNKDLIKIQVTKKN
jgi:hypothetical protein